MMGITELIAGIFTPAADLIDNLHTSDEEKLNIKTKMFELQIQAAAQAQEYEKQLLKAQSDIITAEAKGQGVLQRNWRPVTMLSFLCLVILDSFGLLANDLAPEAWTLLQLGLAGYVIGRSGEKIVSTMQKNAQ